MARLKYSTEELIQRMERDFELLGNIGGFVMFSLENPRVHSAPDFLLEKEETDLPPLTEESLISSSPLRSSLRSRASKPPARTQPVDSKDPAEAPPPVPVPPTPVEPPSQPVPVTTPDSTAHTSDPSKPESGVVELPAVVSILPVDRLVVFPHMIAPITVIKESHKNLVDEALKSDRLIGIFSRKADVEEEAPDSFEHLYELGAVCVILRMLRVPDGSMRLLVHGVARAMLVEPVSESPHLKARLRTIRDVNTGTSDVELEALRKSALSQLQQIIENSPLSEELGVAANNIAEPGKLADLIASNLQLKTGELIEILAETNVVARLKRVLFYLSREWQVLELGSRIQSQVKTEIDKNQKQYVLREQMKAIRQELGEDEPHTKEIRELRERLENKPMPPHAREIVTKELERLEMMQPASAEYGVIRTYLEWFFDLPWEESTPDNIDLAFAEQVLNEDHFGLEKVKERILEFLAVLRLRESMKGPILCFVGPPGVGKTSLGRSIARATGRRFARFSLGGMRDEAEIRGHRRTYIGAMPGRIIKSLKECAANNPLIMLDEIDKLGTDFRGDPASALLEVLDPEQNYTFTDHYMDAPFDLSKVMFITTANQLDTVPGPLRDRMELIEISGYTPLEKLSIAEDYLVPRELIANGLRKSEIRFSPKALLRIVEEYTREAGVRSLQRQVATICRKTARRVATKLGASPDAASAREKKSAMISDPKDPKGNDSDNPPTRSALKPAAHTLPESFGRPKAPGGKARITCLRVDPSSLRELLGPPKIHAEMAQRMGRSGVAIGMAWTPTGGDILFIEASLHPGSGKLTLTGSLGDVMKESAQAALTFLHTQAGRLNIAEETFSKSDLHIHVPAGAVPKDGPSAGTAISAALASLFTGRPVRDYLSMTGEITLRGDVLPVGGVKEKCLAAQRAGIKTILLPKMNHYDYEELPEEVRKKIAFHFVGRVDEVLEHALTPQGSIAHSGKKPSKSKASSKPRTKPEKSATPKRRSSHPPK